MTNPERNLRRWTRLHPEILTRCRVRILEPEGAIECQLLDLSPGGIGILVPQRTWQPRNHPLQLEIRFHGQPMVVRAAEVRRSLPQADGTLLGLAWRMDPEPWNQEERRSRTRLVLPPDALFARIPLRHAHNVWTRLAVVDMDSDFGCQFETRGGPAYLLPGHRAQLHLDLPQLHRRGWDSQVLWLKPSAQGMRIGMRVLDPDPALEEIVAEWLQIRRDWSPLFLQNLGFGIDSLPGQYRFRKVEENAESQAVENFLESMSKATITTGMEPLHGLPIAPELQSMQLACWDGRRLVAALRLEAQFDMAQPTMHSRIADFALEPEWLVAEVFMGLWEQTVRLFLASGNAYLWVWCPPGREHLMRLVGLDPASGPAFPTSPGTWMCVHRDRLISGSGLPATRWAMLYASVSGFVLHHRIRPLSFTHRIRRWRKLATYLLLQDWRQPRERAKLRNAIDHWARDISDQEK